MQEMQSFQEFVDSNDLRKIDKINSQLGELLNIKNPQNKWSEEKLQHEIQEHLNGESPDFYGVWVYYPWLKSVIHLLDEEEFVEVRTSRNKLKITLEEQHILRKKKIGVIGMSVGQASTINLAMESVCGEIRIADFDTLELSNMNRIASSVQDLGLPKVSICKRKIAEIDPFIKVVSYSQGIRQQNIDDFMLDGGKLDLIVEECDALEVKILTRLRARQQEIPVIMETSDRGMLDIERFDLDPDLQILNGRLGEISERDLKELSAEQKKEILFKIIDLEKISERGMRSLAELNKTICSWPQLMSDVSLGAAVVCSTARKLLLGHDVYSGRYYVDLEEIIENPNIITLKDEL